MQNYLWLIPTLPLLGFLVNGLFGISKLGLTGRRPSKLPVCLVACLAVFLAFLLSVVCTLELVGLDPEHRIVEQDLFEWIPGNLVQTERGENAALQVSWGFQLDPLSAIMVLFVTGIGFLIHVYSIGYMADDEGFYRFFTYLNLFMFMMLTLILANNYLLMFVGWEGVGLCSYLLIGFYGHKKSAGDAAKKAFVVNRIGDFGFLLGVLWLLSYFGTLDFSDLFSQVSSVPEESSGVLAWVSLLLFVGAVGKSAQIPLYVWLPDAMEGPTPVSALIHAATMVTAGVYMVARSTAIFSQAPEVQLIVAVVGMATALLAATIGLFQKDIKKVLAYSTVSQLGYMFSALGVGAVVAAIFHVFTHAFFKALLFLGSGSVIHALHHEQDMTRMGGLSKRLPITYWTMLIGALAIAGVPGLSGFFSKDEILWKLYESGHAWLWVVGVLVAGMTAFYMFRLIALTFWGQERMDEEKAKHVHESPLTMTLPLVLLAVGSVLVGYMGLPAWLSETNHFAHFLEPVVATATHHPEAGHHNTMLEIILAGISVLVAGAGIYLAVYFFSKHPKKPELWRKRFQGLHQLIYNKYYVDELYDTCIVNPTKGFGNALSAFDARIVDGFVNGTAIVTKITAWFSGVFDKYVVDGIVNLVGGTVEFWSRIIRRLQSGLVQTYLSYFVVGVILIFGVYLVLGD